MSLKCPILWVHDHLCQDFSKKKTFYCLLFIYFPIFARVYKVDKKLRIKSFFFAKILAKMILKGDRVEEWVRLQNYPGYSASNHGRVRNDKRDRILAIVRTPSRHCYVGLSVSGGQVKRAVSKLIAQTFVENPRPDRFDTPIHLDGDLTNNAANNLLWRPRWFAFKFTQQFVEDQGTFHPIRNINTGEVIDDIWDLVMRDGVLFSDVVLSVANKTFVYPTLDVFEWVD